MLYRANSRWVVVDDSIRKSTEKVSKRCVEAEDEVDLEKVDASTDRGAGGNRSSLLKFHLGTLHATSPLAIIFTTL